MTKTPLCPGKAYTLQEQTDNHDTAWPGPQGGGRAGGLARAPATSFPTMLHTTGQPKPTTRPGHVLSTCTPTPTCALSLPKTLPKSRSYFREAQLTSGLFTEQATDGDPKFSSAREVNRKNRSL